MAINDHPTSLKPENMEWGTVKAGVQFRSQFDGSAVVSSLVSTEIAVRARIPNLAIPCTRQHRTHRGRQGVLG